MERCTGYDEEIEVFHIWSLVVSSLTAGLFSFRWLICMLVWVAFYRTTPIIPNPMTGLGQKLNSVFPYTAIPNQRNCQQKRAETYPMSQPLTYIFQVSVFYSSPTFFIVPSSLYSISTTFMLRSHVRPPLGWLSWWKRYHLPLYSTMEWWVVHPTTGSRITPL